jgi:hypothetical protein
MEEGKDWSQFNAEEQAALIEDAWASGVLGTGHVTSKDPIYRGLDPVRGGQLRLHPTRTAGQTNSSLAG